MLKGLLWTLPCALALIPAVAVAADQPADEPAGTVGGQDAASEGTTELEGQGQFAAAVDPETEDDATEAEISAGGLLSTGNARAASATGAGRVRIRRKRHQFGAEFAGNYGRAALEAGADPQTTVGNVQGRLRYDFFVHPRISLFGMLTARHDRFMGLEARVNVDPGVAFYLLKDPKNRLWTEVGYDFQYDVLTEEATFAKDEDGAIILGTDGQPVVALDEVRLNHAVRLFGGYSNHINDAVTFNTGFEYLQSVLEATRWRLAWDVGLTANLVNRLAIATTLTVRMDNSPPPGIRKVDTISAVSLIFRFF